MLTELTFAASYRRQCQQPAFLGTCASLATVTNAKWQRIVSRNGQGSVESASRVRACVHEHEHGGRVCSVCRIPLKLLSRFSFLYRALSFRTVPSLVYPSFLC